jgi:hypothetical protein
MPSGHRRVAEVRVEVPRFGRYLSAWGLGPGERGVPYAEESSTVSTGDYGALSAFRSLKLQKKLVFRSRYCGLGEVKGGGTATSTEFRAWGVTTAMQAARLTSMSSDTSDRFFSVVIGLAIMVWPSIEGDMTDSAPGSRDISRKKATPAQHSEKKRVPPSPKK